MTLILLLSFFLQNQTKLVSTKKILKLMGSRFEFIAVSSDTTQSNRAIKKAILEVTRIEDLISSWKANSQCSQINKNAGIKAVPVKKELFQLIERSLKVSNLSDGAFDISFASIDRIWKFDGTMKRLPAAAEIKKSVAKINYRNIILDPKKNSVFLKEKGMKIGFGAIGKGYAANRASALMKDIGIRNGLVSAGGDLLAWGKNERGKEWQVAITDPNDKRRIYAWLPATNQAIVTSGNYEKFVQFNGKRYAHIIDPRSGMPVDDLKSVSIVCPDAELADALATSVFVMGRKKGLELINRLKNIEALIVTSDNQILKSKHIQLNFSK